jgi:hypothetical protein
MICSIMIDPAGPLDDDLTAWAEARLRRQVERLDSLSEVGLDLARDIQRQAAADAAMAFSRVARAIRMNALLQSRLIKDMVRTADEVDQLTERLEPAYRHKARVEKIVERVAKAAGDDEDVIDRLVIEAGERLDDEDIYGDVLQRPVGELVALICEDLGLEPDWDGLANEAWARKEIASGVSGSPFNGRALPARPPPTPAPCPAPA